MKKLIEVVQEAGRNCVAIGHFNIADLVILKGVFEAARELKVPVYGWRVGGRTGVCGNTAARGCGAESA